MDINDLRWHDGNILKFELTPNYGENAEIWIHAELYDDSERTPGRDEFLIKCCGVSRFNAVCDLIELNENSEAGSINHGLLKGNILRINLFDGFVEIQAKIFYVSKR